MPVRAANRSLGHDILSPYYDLKSGNKVTKLGCQNDLGGYTAIDSHADAGRPGTGVVISVRVQPLAVLANRSNPM
jgi:hypothetical protein